jgi:flagellin
MRGNVAGYAAVTDSLNRGMSAVDVAMSAGQSISDLLIQMKQKALSASDTSLDTASRQAMNQDFVALRDQITTIVKNACSTASTWSTVRRLRSRRWLRRTARAASRPRPEDEAVGHDRDGQDHGHDLDPGQGFDDGGDDPDLADQRQLGSRQAVGGREEVLDPGDFAQKLSDTLTTGIGNLVDANMAQESARCSPAGQAAAGRSGSVDRQPGAADHSVSVPLSLIAHRHRHRRASRAP